MIVVIPAHTLIISIPLSLSVTGSAAICDCGDSCSYSLFYIYSPFPFGVKAA